MRKASAPFSAIRRSTSRSVTMPASLGTSACSPASKRTNTEEMRSSAMRDSAAVSGASAAMTRGLLMTSLTRRR